MESVRQTEIIDELSQVELLGSTELTERINYRLAVPDELDWITEKEISLASIEDAEIDSD